MEKQETQKGFPTPALLKLANLLEDRYKLGGRVLAKHEKLPSAVVVIVGAGASFSSGMTSWNELKEPVIKTAEDCYRDPRDFIEEAWWKLSPVIGIKDPRWSEREARQKLMDLASVDMICSVACESVVVGEKIRKLFQDRYGGEPYIHTAGAPPQLGYELLAHFLKHQFIDHIITFNFDEVLDTAINNELGQNEYDLILSDKQLLPRLVPDRPRLIKLHGSISSPQTLRFTRDDTGALSNEMIKLLDNTLFIDYQPQRSRAGQRKVHLISLGYSWSDRDFANWVMARMRYISSLNIIQLENQIPVLLRKLGRERNNFINLISTRELSNLLLRSQRKPEVISIDQLLWALWKEIENRFKNEDIEYIPASRHLILGYLFGPDPGNPGPVPKNFLNNHVAEVRLRLEVYLHLVKCKGMVNASVMARDPRISHYYKKFRAAFPEKGNPVDSYKEMSQSQFADVKETYFAKAKTLDELIDQIGRNFHFMGDVVYEPFFNHRSNEIELNEVDHMSFMNQHLEKIFHADEVEVMRWSDPRTEWLFNKPVALGTYLALKQKTTELIQSNWSHLLVIAETGAWLFNNKIINILTSNKRKKKILLLRVSDNALKDWQLREEIENYLEKKEVQLSSVHIVKAGLNWWEHNRHLTLAFDEEEQCFRGGVFFRRRLKTSRISPVYVFINDDCGEMLCTFLSYVRRLYDDKRNEPNREEINREACECAKHAQFSPGLQFRLEQLIKELESYHRSN